MTSKVIAVDLDDTLVKTDMLYESFLHAVKRNPLVLFLVIAWLFTGKAYLKYRLSSYFNFDPSILPYNTELLSWLKAEKQGGAKIYLVSASDEKIVGAIAQSAGIFDGFYGTTLERGNLSGARKAELLNKEFGEKKYVYVGNDTVDIPIFGQAESAVAVGTEKSIARLKKQADLAKTFVIEKNRFKSILKMARIHQWVKNLLIFVPIIPARHFFNIGDWGTLVLAFFSFSFTASFVYILNDLMDLGNDRRNETKKHRPLASGSVSIKLGLFFLPVFLLAGIVLGSFVSAGFLACLAIYFVVTTLYSFRLKKIAVIDCMLLGFLYTFRMVSGIVAISVPISLWFVSFSFLIFFSLAGVKRLSELHNLKAAGKVKTSGRAYTTEDIDFISESVMASGFASVVLFILYVNAEAGANHFENTSLAYSCTPVLLYWILHVSLKARRGEMNEDPVLYAIRDPISLTAGILFTVLFACSVVSF